MNIHDDDIDNIIELFQLWSDEEFTYLYEYLIQHCGLDDDGNSSEDIYYIVAEHVYYNSDDYVNFRKSYRKSLESGHDVPNEPRNAVKITFESGNTHVFDDPYHLLD